MVVPGATLMVQGPTATSNPRVAREHSPAGTPAQSGDTERRQRSSDAVGGAHRPDTAGGATRPAPAIPQQSRRAMKLAEAGESDIDRSLRFPDEYPIDIKRTYRAAGRQNEPR